eukprot:TRINITY_DN46913_c0_g1_i1.p1 TRINITY_DN46913_c0_g1~~TRINITY_DN46913_c0_g1_i1.p1  ORF type:complete len:634 (+),score=203.85 TRINITY_DN46913_c0_g1_i1:75-1976(+)
MAPGAEFTWAEVGRHNKPGDCWLVIRGVVYDLSEFLPEHPGGTAVLLGVAGKDATDSFCSIHDDAMLGMVSNKVIGRVAAAVPAAEGAAAPESEEREVPDAPWPASISPPSALGTATHKVLNAAGDALGLAAGAAYNCVLSPLEWLQRTVAPVRPLQPGTAESPVKVAIVGAGCGGLTAAWALHNTGGYDITVLEAAEDIGGHSFTFQYPTPDGGKMPVDMGFIFGNHQSYSNMLQLMEKIGSTPVETELSLSVDIDGVRFATDGTRCEGMTAPFKMDPRGKAECDRFHAICERWWQNPAFNLIPFGWVLNAYGFSQEFRDLYVTPTLITLFISRQGLYGMSARFMFNMFGGPFKFVDLRHGWRCFTVAQGTQPGWIHRLAAGFKDRCRCRARVSAVRRVKEGGKNRVIVEWDSPDGKRSETFDHVLLACGGKVAGSLVKEQSALERLFFAQIRYEGEHVVLHSDPSFLPKNKDYVRNFNYKDRKGAALPELTGSMAHVARVDPTAQPPILTMNPMRRPKGAIHHERYCAVHVQDLRHMVATRILLPAIEGAGGVWYCGSWCNYLGHSGGLDAGFTVAAALGAAYPLEDPIARDEFFYRCCYDMLGPRSTAWAESVAKHERRKRQQAGQRAKL